MKPLSTEHFAQFVGTSVDHARVFLELADNDPIKARDMYSKVTGFKFVPFEVLRGTRHVPSSKPAQLQTLFTMDSSEGAPANYQGTVVSFYTNGFTVNHGPLRDFEEPQNRQFIEQLQQGMIRGICPTEFLSEQANENNEIKIRIERKNKPWNPFCLRNEKSPEDTFPFCDIVDYGTMIKESTPVTKIKIGLPHDTNLVLVCNTCDTVENILGILALALGMHPSRLSLETTHPRKSWKWGHPPKQTSIQDTGLSFSHAFLRISPSRELTKEI